VTRRQGEEKPGDKEKKEVMKLRSWEDLCEQASACDNRSREGSPTIYVSAFG